MKSFLLKAAVACGVLAIGPIAGPAIGEHIGATHAAKDNYGHVHSVADRALGLGAGEAGGIGADLLLLSAGGGFAAGRLVQRRKDGKSLS